MIYENQRKLQTQTPKTKVVQQTRIKKKKEKKKTLEVFEGHPFTNTSGRGQTPNLSPQKHK